MATRKPLVLVSGLIQQLQAADTLSGPFADTEYQTFTNDDAGAHALGDLVYLDAADGVKKAKADAVGTSKVIAVAVAAVAAAASGSYQTGGIVTGLAGLVFNNYYWLSPTTAGLLTATPPSAVGQYSVLVGIALSATELKLMIQPIILL